MINDLRYGRVLFESIGFVDNDSKYTYNIRYIYGDGCGSAWKAPISGKLKVINFKNRLYELYISDYYLPLAELVEPLNLIINNGVK